MPSITDVIQELNHFSPYRRIPEVLTVLRSLSGGNTVLRNLSISKKIDDETINSLRTTINELLLDDDSELIIQSGIYLTDACHSALLAVAEFRPVNPEDPITLEKINSSNKVFVSTGHQFDIYTLINYHNNRPCRAELNEEQFNYKPLLNPITDQKFSYRDAAHIRNVAAQKQIAVTSLVDASRVSVMTYAEDIKIMFARMSIDELADRLGLLLKTVTDIPLHRAVTWFNDLLTYCRNNMDVLSNEAIDLFALFIVLLGCEVAIYGYVADHLIVDISHLANPSLSKSRVGFSEAGMVIGGSIVITALIARSMFRTEKNERPVNERERNQQLQYVAHH